MEKSGEGKGNSLQNSCPKHPVDREAWWAAVLRVVQSRTWLRQLSRHACIGEGNGNLLQYSCLENPVDREAHRVTQSRTQLKWLSMHACIGEGNGNPLAWRILGTEEPDGLPSRGSHRVRHDWSNLACMHALEKEMATHSSILAWRIPGTEEPGGLLPMGSQRVGHDWSDLAAAEWKNHQFTKQICKQERKEQRN